MPNKQTDKNTSNETAITINSKPSTPISYKKSFSFEVKILIAQSILIVLILISTFVYYKISQEKIKQASQFIKEHEVLQQEKQNCLDLINQEKGDFSKYEYCKQILKVFNDLTK